MLRSWALPPIFHYFPPFILCSQSLVPHLFPHAPLGPPPNHLTSHLMDHLTIPQSDITCHHSAVRSTLQHHHLTHYGLPAHCHVVTFLGTWPTFFFLFLTDMYLYDHMTSTHMTAYLYKCRLVENFIVLSFCTFPIVLLSW